MVEPTTVLAFLGGAVVSPLVILAAVGLKNLSRFAILVGKQIVTEAEAKPQTPERNEAINEAKQRLEKLEETVRRLEHPRSD